MWCFFFGLFFLLICLHNLRKPPWPPTSVNSITTLAPHFRWWWLHMHKAGHRSSHTWWTWLPGSRSLSQFDILFWVQVDCAFWSCRWRSGTSYKRATFFRDGVEGCCVVTWSQQIRWERKKKKSTTSMQWTNKTNKSCYYWLIC